MYSKFATFFIYLDLSNMDQLQSSFSKTNGTNLRHSVHKLLHYRKACNYLAYFSNYLMVVFQSPHCKRKNYCFSLSFLFSYSFLTHKNTTHTTTFTVCNDEPIRKQLKLSHCVEGIIKWLYLKWSPISFGPLTFLVPKKFGP